MTIYDFTAKTNQNHDISLSEYRGKVLLVVNTATKCGLTPQYTELEKLYQTYRERGFEILDFPCNQFMKQAPGSDEDIQSFCTLKYNTTFPRFAKINVNGNDAHALFKWLKEEISEDETDDKSKSFAKMTKLMKPFAKPGDIKWNFGKFLLNRGGEVVGRYSPAFTPDKLEIAIEGLL